MRDACPIEAVAAIATTGMLPLLDERGLELIMHVESDNGRGRIQSFLYDFLILTQFLLNVPTFQLNVPLLLKDFGLQIHSISDLNLDPRAFDLSMDTPVATLCSTKLTFQSTNLSIDRWPQFSV